MSIFKCSHCSQIVQTGVFQRNHCPFCLFSLHADKTPGDRKSPCKGLMQPIGLTFKKVKDKYNPDKKGELMLVHKCLKCGNFSINRLTSDDNPDIIQKIFRQKISHEDLTKLKGQKILPLEEKNREEFQKQLFGKKSD